MILQLYNLELALQFRGPFYDTTVPTLLQVNSEEWAQFPQAAEVYSWVQGMTQQQEIMKMMGLG